MLVQIQPLRWVVYEVIHLPGSEQRASGVREALKVNHQERWSFEDLHLFFSVNVILALATVPLVWSVESFFF